jgi:predicted ABC-type sugar transport system permease subunit
MSKRKVILAVVLPVTITIVFALADLTLPLREVTGLCLTVFAGFLLSYLWVWKPRKVTFGRLTLTALVVSGVMAAMLVISNLLARILPGLRH